jgi:hypothetical protein
MIRYSLDMFKNYDLERMQMADLAIAVAEDGTVWIVKNRQGENNVKIPNTAVHSSLRKAPQYFYFVSDSRDKLRG